MDRLEIACDAALTALALPRGQVRHAVTMSGEMADLFPDRASGVVAIVDFIRLFVSRRRQGDDVRIFAGPAGFMAAESVRSGPGGNTEAVASANWLATAQRCAGLMGDGILVDIGSTTTDLIPVTASRVGDVGGDDRTRLERGELVYAGIVRTPLMALARRAPFGGSWRATMNEHFATTADVFRILGELDEDSDLHPAADGAAKTTEASARRLLRMVGDDLPASSDNAVRSLAHWYRSRLLDMIVEALAQRLSRADLSPAAVMVGAGVGRFLLPELAARMQLPMRQIDSLLCGDDGDVGLRRQAGYCAPAVAVAQLLQVASA
jgi:probable H4MPT-linked C1 transfer pathway protein